MAIADIFRGGVQNPLSISGRLESGSVQVADKVIIVPSKETAVIKGIEVDGEPADYAVAGQNTTMHLADIDPAYLHPGDVLCSVDKPLKSLKEFTVKILAFDHVTPGPVDVHRGRLHVAANIAQLKGLLDKATGAVIKKKARLIKPGEVARIKIVAEGESSIPVEADSRVVIRSGGQTIAAGLVEKIV